MTDWSHIAASLDPPVPDAAKIVPVLETLETAFRKLQRSMPEDTEPWSPENVSE